MSPKSSFQSDAFWSARLATRARDAGMIVAIIVVAMLQSGIFNPAKACSLRVVGIRNAHWNAGPQSGYDVFDASGYAQAVELTIAQEGPACDYFVATDEGSHGRYTARILRGGGNRLRYNLFAEAQGISILKAPPNASPGEMLNIHYDGTPKNARVVLFWRIEPGQWATPGLLLSDTLALQLYLNRDPQNILEPGALLAQRQLRLSTQIAAKIRGGLAAEGTLSQLQSINLTLGDLRKGRRRAVDLVIQTNIPYAISFASTHKQTLQRETRIVGATPLLGAVPYRFLVDGRPVNLKRGEARLSAKPKMQKNESGNNGQQNRFASSSRHRLEIIIGKIQGQPTGVYADSIRMTVTAR